MTGRGTNWFQDKTGGPNTQKVTIATIRKITNKPEIVSFGNGGDCSSEGKEYDNLIQLKEINNVQDTRIKAPKECS